ncbi:MAG: Glucose-6-phosphate 1-dehydrogenase [Marteilia pararefringens]
MNGMIKKFDQFLIIFGASGNLAKELLYPSLYKLYQTNSLRKFNLNIILVSQGPFGLNTLLEAQKNKFPSPDDTNDVSLFFSQCTFLKVIYNDMNSFSVIFDHIKNASVTFEDAKLNFYLALPDSLYKNVLDGLNMNMNLKSNSNVGLAIEKPFGTNSATSKELEEKLMSRVCENQIYRIDHFLNKFSVKNLLTLKFYNTVFEPLLQKDHIQCILISQKEQVGAEGRRAFDRMGIISDIMQNHLLEILACLLMDLPKDDSVEAIKEEKIKILQSLRLKSPDDVIVGQYKSYGEEYKDSKTASFASFVLTSDGERFKDVPIIMSAGKKLSEKKCEIRILFKESQFSQLRRASDKPFPVSQNELVIRIQPNDAIYLKTNVNVGGYNPTPQIDQVELDLNFNKRFKRNFKSEDKNDDRVDTDNVSDQYRYHLPHAYELCILNILEFDRHSIVSSGEVEQCWRIIDPINEIASCKPLVYYDDNILKILQIL